GYDTVREILDTLGYDYITLKQESFDNDLQWSDAIAMLTRLVALSKEVGLGFGVKLTNTLGSVNDQGVLGGDEMYMSGRALLPISTTVGERLSKEFDGKLPISYSGGATAFTIKELFESGIRPITLATDLLKPGGYTRLKQLVEILEESRGWEMQSIDIPRLEQLATKARTGAYAELEKQFRGTDAVKVYERLPMWDCYVAPCVEACPIHQAVPEYVQLVGQGRYGEALQLIYDTNALPGITGHICDHQCQLHCTRMDYEGAVKIRDMKRIAVENGFADFKERWEGPPEKSKIKAAVVGAGPAGLSAAYFLARAGFDTTVYEREESAGGIVRHVIPGFRLPVEAIESDIRFIEAHGVKFNFGADIQSLDIATLKERGYHSIFYAIGSEVDNEIPLQGDRSRVRPSLAFLSQFRRDPASLSLGKHVVVVGGGNTAMDGARAAHRVAGVEKVTVLYRRTEAQMPADHEEFANAKADGIEFIFLANPERFEERTLTVRRMKLGEKDESGRRKPLATDETFTIECDTMITAIGERPDGEQLTWYGVPTNEKGWPIADDESLESEVDDVYIIGDVYTGPSTIVRCIASGRKAVESAIDKILGPEDEDEHNHDDDWDDDEDYSFEESEEIVAAENEFFAELAQKRSKILTSKIFGDAEFARIEAERCMECSYVCNKCVDVCPNRANVAIDVRNTGFFEDPFQILHLDAFCNECGNCETFCPYDGGPYRKKFTLFNTKEDFDDSSNSGFWADGPEVLVRMEGRTVACSIDGDGLLAADAPIDDEAAAMIETIYTSYSYLLGYVEE
ncbi:MAG: putative selenate reductase subunit YgfK, partial [Spirochaetales bacterium]|nr:putative selenate reductase subunit YgfK [Spirochaetales bacterium]